MFTTRALPEWLDRVVRAWTVAWPENWNADAANDGIRVWVELQDAGENEIEYTDMNMPVQIEIYSTESVTYPWERSRLIYSGPGALTNWEHDAFVTGATGVKDVLWGQISAHLPMEQQEYGMLYVTVTLPNGTNYSAEYDPVEIKAAP